MKPKAFRPWFDRDGYVIGGGTAHLVVGDIEPYRNISLPGAPLINSRSQERELLRAYGKEAVSLAEVQRAGVAWKAPKLPDSREQWAAALDKCRMDERRKKHGR